MKSTGLYKGFPYVLMPSGGDVNLRIHIPTSLLKVYWREEQGVEAMQAACEESRAAAERIFILQLLTDQLDPQVYLRALLS